MKKILVLTMALVLATSGLAMADILDFEDLYPGFETYGAIPSSYHGFTMSSQCWYMSKYAAKGLRGIGYENGTIGEVSMFNAFYQPISLSKDVPFDVNELLMTAAINDSQNAIIQGWLGGKLRYSTTVSINNLALTPVVLNWTGIDTLSFNSGPGLYFVIDNIIYNVSAPLLPQNVSAPLPSTLLFVGTGLLGLAGRRFRK